MDQEFLKYKCSWSWCSGDSRIILVWGCWNCKVQGWRELCLEHVLRWQNPGEITMDHSHGHCRNCGKHTLTWITDDVS